MRTTLTIDCDIRDAQAILYSASKIISSAGADRDQERLDKLCKHAEKTEPSIKYDDRKEWSEAGSLPDLRVASQSSMEPPEVVCPFCDWTGYIIELKIDDNKSMRCPKCHGHIIGEDVDVTKKGVV